MFVSLQLAAALAAGCGDSGDSPRLPKVSDIGGPKMAHPQLVPIFFSDDPDVAALTSYSQWIVTSSWLHAVGAEYGVVHKAARAPDTISDTEIVNSLFQGLADGTLPQPAAGGLGEVIYVVNYPSHTVVTAGSETSCVDFGGYHYSARRNGVELAYAVIPTCPTFRNDLDGDLAVTTPVDVAAEGTAFVDVAFTIANAAKDETLVASVGLETTTTPFPAMMYVGPIGMAKVAPDSVVASTDRQSAELRAIKGTASRALRRPFRVGGKTEYTLPSSIDGPQWAIDNGQLSVISSSLPDLDVVFVSAGGSTMDDSMSAHHDLELSSQFLAATGVVRFIIDIDIPDYKPEWKVDFTRLYPRDLTIQGTANGERSTRVLVRRERDCAG